MSFHKYALDTEIVADYLTEVSTDNVEEMENIGRRNEAVSAMIDSYCERPKGYFLPAPNTATPRTFRGENSSILRIPIHVSGSVQVSGISAAEYYENDRNGWLFANGNNSRLDCSNFWSRSRVYTVSARWGYAETPAEIIEATKIIVAHLFGNGSGIMGDLSPGGFILARDMPPTARTLLQPFIKKEFEID